MTEIIDNVIKVLTSFFLVLFINKALSIFRRRQLYLSCWNCLKNNNLSNNSCTINGSIYNKGKDKEKNVEISIPSGFKISLISSNYNSIKSDNGRIIIDRILPKQKISIIALVEGTTEIDKKIKPEIKSEDTNGKTYLTEDIVPPSTSWMFFSLSISIFFIGTIAYTKTLNDNVFVYIEDKYNEYKYSNLYTQGFKLSRYKDNELIDKFNIENNELPISLLSVTESNGYIDYKFEANNPTNYTLKLSIKFDTINTPEFSKKMRLLDKEYDALEDSSKESADEMRILFNERTRKTIDIYDEHNIDYTINNDSTGLEYPLIKHFDFKINPMETQTIHINKKVKQGFNNEYFKMNIEVISQNTENEENLSLEFRPENSKYKKEFEDIILKYK